MIFLVILSFKFGFLCNFHNIRLCPFGKIKWACELSKFYAALVLILLLNWLSFNGDDQLFSSNFIVGCTPEAWTSYGTIIY
jgi:hypothetical protein